MAESKLFDFMNVDLPEPKRSNVPWRFVNRFTASPGYINVSACIEVLPTDRWTGNLHSILRSRPTIDSIYGSFRESHQAFFVPARLYSKVLDQLQTFGGSDFDPNANIQFPSIFWKNRSGTDSEAYSRGINLPCSLLSQLKMFPPMFSASLLSEDISSSSVSKEIRFNAIPIVGYYDILRNYYYNDQELDMPFISNEFYVSGRPAEQVFGGIEPAFLYVSRSVLDDFVSQVYENSDSVEYQVYPPVPLFSTEDELSDGTIFSYSFSAFLEYLDNQRFDNNGIDAIRANHLGLGVRTYDDDYFTVSLNNDYVDELNNTARVVVSNGSFSVTQMQRANRLHKHVSRNVLRGSDYQDYLYVHFNAKLGREFNKPVFLGSVSNDFYFDDIYSTYGEVQNSPDFLANNNLGSRAGVLNSRFSSNDGFIDFTAQEYGYIMVLSSIIPRVSYSHSTPRMFLKTGTSDLYSPEFDAWSFQDVFASEVWTGTNFENQISSSFVDQWSEVVKSQPAWFEHLAPYDYVGGLFATDLQYGFQTLVRSSYNRGDVEFENFIDYSILSSYIRPWEWNYIFQFQAPWFDNFEWQIMFDFNAYRPISKQILPSM